MLIVQQEDPIHRLQKRAEIIIVEKERHSKIKPHMPNTMLDLITSNLWFHTEGQLSFDNEESIKNLELVIAAKGIRLVVIDPLYSLGDSTNYFANFARVLSGPIKQMCRAYGVTFLLVHHRTKNAAGNGRTSMWGSSLLNAAVDGALLIDSGRRDNEIKVTRSGKAYNDRAAYWVSFDIDTGDPGHYTIAAESTIPGPKADTDQAILEILRTNGPSSAAEIARLLEIDRSTTSRRLPHLVAQGYVLTTGSGNRMKYFIPDTDMDMEAF